MSFDARLDALGIVRLDWSTSSESNNGYFELWRSTDGIDFALLAKVAGKGNSTKTQRYQATDLSPQKGVNYYSLVQFDKDGKYQELGIRSIKVNLEGEDKVLVYPTQHHQ